ncbi:3-hydroxyacyl-CoA dehydrogenase NAD-binding domain-containing protein [Maricurvus nonylphenolicus]|uniref:3-hydroxyacyl-CoA dehydrogenase NAD-binding domain-containing protein n=1 Tax=Maricurvus nonylphenolicus TaxID=1008307 RepID=UPI0036F2431B
MTQVTYELRNNIAVLQLSSPPVNSLGLSMRQAIMSNFQKALADENVDAIVLASSGSIFCGGADISEFDGDLAFASPNLSELCDFVEGTNKLVIAAINGMALGGGCELTLACDYRIADKKAKIGLPEVQLGILPGAGGTQRMPRLAGAPLALEMISSGKPVAAQKLLEAKAIDRLALEDEALLEAAVNYAEELVADDAPLRNCADMAVDISDLPEDYFFEFRRKTSARTQGFYAPEQCIQAVEAACALPLAEGIAFEANLFRDCMETPQARAQQHLFFSERAATKIPGIQSKTLIRPINRVAVIGSGTMGGGIAMNFINAGIETVVLDLNAEALERGIATIRRNYEISAKKGRFTQAQVDSCLSLLKSTTEYSDISDVDLVIEAVFERMDIKQQVFKTLDEVCKPGAILATNTSTLDVNEIAAVTSRPEAVVGTHFFSPANVMRLLEIVRAEKTADDVLMTTIKLAQKIKKVPVVSGVCWGFIGNRMIEPYGRETARLILEGASPAQIDQALTDFGLAMGFPSMADLAGIDVSYLIRQENAEACYPRDPHYAAILDKLYELGRYGQKSGRGFYIYEGRDKREDPEVMTLAADLANELGIKQRAITDQEIVERTMYVLINEGAQILDEGIAYRSGDIDIVYCNGYGFPIFKGGPMQFADEIGLDKILAALNGYRQSLGDYGEEWFKPAPLLERLVEQNKSFKDYQ